MTKSNPERRPDYLRVRDIVRPHGLLPICASTWWAWVKAKKAPRPRKISSGVTVWDRAEVVAFMEAKP